MDSDPFAMYQAKSYPRATPRYRSSSCFFNEQKKYVKKPSWSRTWMNPPGLKFLHCCLHVKFRLCCDHFSLHVLLCSRKRTVPPDILYTDCGEINNCSFDKKDESDALRYCGVTGCVNFVHSTCTGLNMALRCVTIRSDANFGTRRRNSWKAEERVEQEWWKFQNFNDRELLKEQEAIAI